MPQWSDGKPKWWQDKKDGKWWRRDMHGQWWTYGPPQEQHQQQEQEAVSGSVQ